MSAGLVRVVFELERDAQHGSATERLWAEPLGRDRFRLRNSPFYAFGVSNEDVVLGTQSDEQIRFTRVVIRGGHSTYRLKLHAPAQGDVAFSEAWAPLGRLGCSYEEGPVLAVDVPPSTDIYAVYKLLEDGESSGVWEFEEGHCGHALRG